ncbi:hypothetical protein LZ198_07405 [Myxococcus sp. K15C18031901]|uniref:hypothetical protein n=1 Tax=Myxococcus dinghuensis TaxID=2906761 RepID=UPI0020A70257|nr:hypothetical protein [Myxococcus dinghuensis]MCP3098702.1 hypothetical protein [Myxococcus dinghuensis]
MAPRDAGSDEDAGNPEDASTPEPDAGPVERPGVLLRITNIGTCAAKLLTTQKTPTVANNIQVAQGELRGTGFRSCSCPKADIICMGNNYPRAYGINPGETVEFVWEGLRYVKPGGGCNVQPLSFGPVTVTVPYFTLADEATRYAGPEVDISQTFDYSPDSGVVELILNPPNDPLVDGSPGVCP